MNEDEAIAVLDAASEERYQRGEVPRGSSWSLGPFSLMRWRFADGRKALAPLPHIVRWSVGGWTLDFVWSRK